MPNAQRGFCDDLLGWVDRHRRWVLGGVVGLYLVGLNGSWRIGADSALYADLARSLVEGRGYQHLGVDHGLAYPGLPYVLAGLFEWFGPDCWLAVNVVMLATALAALALVYRLIRLHADRPTAVMVVLLVGVCETMYRYAFQALTDMPFLLGVVMLLCGYEGLRVGRERGGAAVWNGLLLAAGLAVMTGMRPIMIPIHAAVILTGVVGLWRGPQRGLHGLLIALSVSVLVGFTLIDPRHAQPVVTAAAENPARATRGYEDILRLLIVEHFGRTLRVVFLHHLPKWLWHGIFAEAVVGIALGLKVLHLLLGVALAGLSVGLFRRRALWGWTVLAVLTPMALFEPKPRYILPILPLVMFAGWQGLCWLSLRMRSHWTRQVLCAVLVGLMIGPNLVKSASLAVEQRRTPFYTHYHGGRYVPVLDMAAAIEAHTPDGALIISDHARQLSYLTHRRVMAAQGTFRDYDPGVVVDWLAGQPAVFIARARDADEADPVAGRLLAHDAVRAGPALHTIDNAWWSCTLHELHVEPRDPNRPTPRR